MATSTKVKRRVLVVDDEETMRLFLASSLEAHLGVEVQLAATCEQALRFAEASAYDAILVDLLMPGIGGLAVLYRVRRSGPNAATPVIVISAVKDEESIERCMNAGASAYLVKPVAPAELARTVKQHLGS
jgi:CheY-like chemotaxis protein